MTTGGQHEAGCPNNNQPTQPVVITSGLTCSDNCVCVRLKELQREKDYLVTMLMDVINQSCRDGDYLDSMAISSYALAIDYLINAGKMRKVDGYGRRIIAEFVITDKAD